MALLKKAKSILVNTCVIFSLTVFLVLSLWAAISGSKLASTEMLLIQALIALAFSFIIACLNEIFKVRSLKIFWRVFIHFAGCMLCFYLFFIRMGSYAEKNSGELIIMILVGLIYVVIAAIVLLVRHIRNRKVSDGEKYEAQFNFEK